MSGVSTAAAVQAATLRMAVLQVRANQLVDQLKAARAAAQPLYALHRAAGNKQVTPVLPGGTEAGTVSIKGGAASITWDEPALLALVEEADPGSAEDYVPVSALTDKRVVDLIREQLPDLVRRRVVPERKQELEEIVIESGGFLLNLVTGEKAQVAGVFRSEPTGEFAYKPEKKGTAAILAALAAGTVTEDGEAVRPAGGGGLDAG